MSKIKYLQLHPLSPVAVLSPFHVIVRFVVFMYNDAELDVAFLLFVSWLSFDIISMMIRRVNIFFIYILNAVSNQIPNSFLFYGCNSYHGIKGCDIKFVLCRNIFMICSLCCILSLFSIVRFIRTANHCGCL